MSNSGQLAGNSSGTYPLVHAFFWDPVTGVRNLGCLPGFYSAYAWGMNDLGQVVGDCRTYYQSNRAMFVWDRLTGMRNLGYGIARDINNSGLIIGTASLGAFVHDGVSLQYLPKLPSTTTTSGYAISNSGLIAGSSYINGAWRATLWAPVPEPSGMAGLAGTSFLAVMGLRRRWR